jgi:hypothetical protein
MKKTSLFVLIQILIFVCSLFGQDLTRKIIKIDVAGKPDQTVKELLKSGIDVTAMDPSTSSINALVTESELQQIKTRGFPSEVLLADADAFARQLRQSGYFDHFHNYQQMLDEMQQVVADHPDLALLEDIGDSYEKTVGRGGYDIWALKISDNVQLEENEPEVFYMANTHAREIITPEIILYFMHYLIDNYGKDGYVTYLVNNRQIWLCPTINPDGHEYVFSGSSPSNYGDPMWWRKNKRDNNSNGVFDPSGDGVDLNRNFGYKWGYDDSGSSPLPSSQTYRGTAAFSEPESQAIRDFVTRHKFIINLSFHSYSQLWLYPWGYISQLTPDNDVFVALAESCVAYNHYKPEPGFGLYTTNGSTDDWFYGEQTTKNKVFGFTPEVGNLAESVNGNTGFFPDTSFIQKQILENQGPMLYLTYVAGEPPIINHQPFSETESPGPYLITATIKPPIILTAPVPLDTSSYRVYFNTTGVAPFDSVLMQPTGNPDEYAGNIPGIAAATRIYYYISAADQNGRSGRMPRGAPMAVYSFGIGADLVPPVISHRPITFQSLYATGFLISATVTDNIGISQVMLFFRKNGGQLDSLEMLPGAAANEFQATITPIDSRVGDYYEYKIIAFDNSRQRNQSQLPQTGFYRFEIQNSLLYDFELEASFAPTFESDWEWGTPTSGPKAAYSGSKLWATNLKGNYRDLTESILESPAISLAQKDSAKLTFWHWYQNEYSDNAFWDGGNVKISVDGGPFQLLYPQGGYDGIVDPYNGFLGNEPCFGGPATNGNFWQQETFDLSEFKDHTIVIRFHFGSDGAVNDYGWYIDDVEIAFSQPTAVAEKLSAPEPLSFELNQNYPNPFNPSTEISYSLEQSCHVQLAIFNLAGQQIKSLINAKQPRGQYSVTWQGTDEQKNPVASGIYFCRLTLKGEKINQTLVKKMLKLM